MSRSRLRTLRAQPEPRFLFPQCRFGAGALDGVPRPLGDVANELDLPVVHTRGVS